MVVTSAESRKERRKEKRRARKKHQQQQQHHHQRGKQENDKINNTIIKNDTKKEKEENKERRSTKKRHRDSSNNNNNPTKSSKLPKKQQKQQQKQIPNDDQYSHLEDDELAAALRKDDAEIADLEAKLGLKSSSKKERKRLHKEYAKLEGYGDDFGQFLDGLDDMIGRVTTTAGQVNNGEEDEEEDFEEMESMDNYILDQKEEEDQEEEEEEEEEEVVLMKEPASSTLIKQMENEEKKEEENLMKEEDQQETNQQSDSSQDSQEDNGDEFSDSEEEEEDDDDNDAHTYQPTIGQDIYGKNLHHKSSAAPPPKYVPPHLRNRPTKQHQQPSSSSTTTDEVTMTRLRRSINGPFNRLSDGTLESTSKSLAILLYSSSSNYSTHDIHQCLWSTIQTSCIVSHMIVKSLIPLYVACIAALQIYCYSYSKQKGMGDAQWLGAYIVEMVVKELLQELENTQTNTEDNIQNKEQEDDSDEEKVNERNDQINKKSTQSDNHTNTNNTTTIAHNDDDNTTAEEEIIVDKKIMNYVLLLCYLYNYNIIHCTLLYDLIKSLLQDGLTEINVEILLLILNHCGYQLRLDDPSALKDIVLAVQDRALQLKTSAEKKEEDDEEEEGGGNESSMTVNFSSRVSFMLSAMIDLKNNRKKRQRIRDTSTSVDGITGKIALHRKILGTIKQFALNHGGNSSGGGVEVARLRLSLDDIRNIDTKGRWWKVGASWTGNQFHSRHTKNDDDEDTDETFSKDPSSSSTTTTNHDSNQSLLLHLASKQRMNTDVRRSIFCIIMGSTDCEDAFEKLIRANFLRGNTKQFTTERDVIRVLVDCCLHETTYNPFYGFLARRICEYIPKCKFTLKLVYWDIFQQLFLRESQDEDEKTNANKAIRKAANLAKLASYLVQNGSCLNMFVLKDILIEANSFSSGNSKRSSDEDEDVAMVGTKQHENILIFLTMFFTQILEQQQQQQQQQHHDDNKSSNIESLFQFGPKQHIHKNSQQRTKKQFWSDADLAKIEESESLKEHISIFLLQYIQKSPKNVQGSIFRKNYKAVMKACETNVM